MKLCRKIIFSSIIISVALFLISLTLELLKVRYPLIWDNSATAFAQTWLSGIACSLIVVIFTTYIQHQFEETNAFISLGVNLFIILSKYISLEKAYPKDCENAEDFDLDKTNELLADCMQRIENEIGECLTLSYSFAPLTVKKKRVLNTLSDSIEEVDNNLKLYHVEKTPFDLYCLMRENNYFVNLAKSTVAFYKRETFNHFKTQLTEWLESREDTKKPK